MAKPFMETNVDNAAERIKSPRSRQNMLDNEYFHESEIPIAVNGMINEIKSKTKSITELKPKKI